MEPCKGDGMCLLNDDRLPCDHNCKPIKCPNYFLCCNADPQCVLWCHHNLCTSCDIAFGTWQGGSGVLQQVDNIQCPVCFERNKIGVRLPKCVHILCTECFKKCFMIGWDDDRTGEPPFPYGSDIEKEYLCDPDNQKWKHDKLIQEWSKRWIRWDDERQDVIEQQSELLAKCPMCRIK